MDIEGIATDMEDIATKKKHICIRSMYILSQNGVVDEHSECYPCKRFEDLEQKYKNAFTYCYHNIHRLPYYPKKSAPICSQAEIILRTFIEKNSVKIIFYKGGHIERDLCNKIGVECFDIENFSAPRANSHDPKREVRQHYEFLISNHALEVRDLLSRYL